MLTPVLVTPPAGFPVSLEAAKRHCRVVDDEDDQRILAHIRSATGHLDGYSGILGRCLLTQTWRQPFHAWHGLRLPFPDVQSVQISYFNTTGAAVVVPASNYRLVPWHSSIAVHYASGWSAPSLMWEADPHVSVTFTAGYGTAADVPEEIKDAILLHVEALYDRLPEQEWRPAYDALIGPRRVVRL